MRNRIKESGRLNGILAGLSLVFLLSLLATHQALSDEWTASTSEENGEASPAHCNDSLVTGLQCTGRRCDNIKLLCGAKQPVQGQEWSPYFSEENQEGYTCPNNEFVQAVRCQGRYCDGLSVQCAKAPETEVDPSSCYWKPGVSEENGGTVEFGQGTHLRGLRCRGQYCDSLEAFVCPTKEKVCASEECKFEQAKRFAPILRFDQEQTKPNKCFPSDAGEFWNARKNGNKERICNESAESLANGQIPVYYAYEDCSRETTVIMYWFFYGFQDTCSPGLGSHNADWERVAVKIKNGRLERVLYFQHGGSYTRQGHDLQVQDETHAIAFIGKNSHGSYHDGGGSGSCLYFEDYRNPGPKELSLHTADNLIPLKNTRDAPEWMKSFESKNFDGIPGPLNRGINLCSLPGCVGNDIKVGDALCFGECGCSRSSIGSSPF